MAKKAKKRKFSPEHLASLRAAHKKRRGKPRSKSARRGKSAAAIVETSSSLDRLKGLVERLESALK